MTRLRTIVHRILTSRLLVAAIVAAGIALRLWQFLANPSLWVDEAALARNIVDRSAITLLAPLDYGQVAPAGFLLIEKLAVALFGNNEYALRLFPLLSGLGSLLLVYALARRMLGEVGMLVALAMFALGLPFVYFPSQVKPYSSDIAAGLLVLLLGLHVWRKPAGDRGALALGLTGAAIPWFSYPSVFTLTGVGAALVALALSQREREFGRRTLITVSVWAAGALLAIVAARRGMTAADGAFMQQYWAAGFAPVPPHSLHDALWPWRQVVAAFGVFSNAPPALDGGMHYRYPLLFASLALVGLWSLWRRGRHLALFVVLPIAATFAAAGAHLYPFSGRVAVTVIPLLAIATAAAVEDAELYARRLVGEGSLTVPALLAVIVLQALARNPPPDRQEDMKSVLAYVRDRRAAGDGVYVYYGAGQAFLYYARRYDFRPDEYTVGSCARHEPRVYLNELDRFRGRRRVWAVFSHSTQNGKEIRLATAYLDRIGRRLEEVPATDAPLGAGSYAFLYDLSDPQQLAKASAASYPVPRDDPDSSWLCYGTMTPVKLGLGQPGRSGRPT